ncbi:MAG: septum site-determining protein MinC [Marinobacter sp.]|nr:septum site-determining protein MinC [Marinobacter sp.]
MPDSTNQPDQPCFKLKSANISLTALELQYFDAQDFEQALREKINQAPGFFKDGPLIISLEKYEGLDSELDFFQIIGICRRHKIHVVGVRGGNDDQRRLARHASLALFPAAGQRQVDRQEAEAAAEPPVAAADSAETPQDTGGEAKVVLHPVRSGQQIFAPDGDLVILGPVQAGAEVLAKGSIHVYGPLRGRALAGVRGQAGARIFCQSLEAELVSIAGHYKISEDLQENGWKTAVQVQLKDDLLVVSPLEKN